MLGIGSNIYLSTTSMNPGSVAEQTQLLSVLTTYCEVHFTNVGGG